MNATEIPSPADLAPDSAPLSQSAISKSLRLYLMVLLLLTAVAWTVSGVRGYILHEPYPQKSLLTPREYRFTDFTYDAVRVAHFGERDMLSRTDFPIPFSYPLPAVYAFLFFMRLFPNGLYAYLAFTVAAFFIATCVFSIRVHRASPGKLPQLVVWLTLFTSFPLLSLLDRGNIEGVIWIFLLCGMVAYTRKWMVLAAIFFSLAASMKVAPGLLFLLFIAKRRYGVFALAILLTITFSILALAGVGPTVKQAFVESQKAAAFLKDNFLIARSGPGYDTSIFGAIKQGFYLYEWHAHAANILKSTLAVALQIYTAMAAITAGLLYWFRLRHLPILNQFMAYTVMFLLLPQISNEYKLVHMYLPWAAFLLFFLTDVKAGRWKIPQSAGAIILISCAVLFAPLTYIIFGRSFMIGGQIKAVFLALILWQALRVPMPSSLFGDLDVQPSSVEPV